MPVHSLALGPGDNTLVLEGRRPLYLATVLNGPMEAREGLYKDILRIAQQSFLAPEGDGQLALMAVLANINQFLYQKNQNRSKPAQYQLHLVAIAILEDTEDGVQALGAIAGMGQIIVMDRVSMARYPTPPPPQATYIPTTESLPLGHQSSMAPSFYRLGLQDGKIMLLCADATAGKLSDKNLRTIITRVTALAGQAPALPAGGLILTVGPQSLGQTLKSLEDSPIGDPPTESAKGLPAPAAQAETNTDPIPFHQISTFSVPRQVPMDDLSGSDIQPGAMAEADIVTENTDSSASEMPEEEEDFHFGPTASVTHAAGQDIVGPFENYGPSSNPYALIAGKDLAKVPRKPPSWRFRINLSQLSRHAASTILSFGSGLNSLSRSVAGTFAIFLRRILPEPVNEGKDQPLTRHRMIFRTMAIAIPLFLILLTLGAYWEAKGSQQARAAASLEEAQNRYQVSLSSKDELTARETLNAAQIAVDQALSLQPQLKEAQALKAQIMRQMDSINGVVRLNDISLLADLKEQGSMGGRLLIQGNYLYVLDKGTGRVLRYSLASNRMGLSDPSATIIASRGESMGANHIGDLIDMALFHGPNMAQTEIGMILDSNGILLRSNPALPAIELVNLPGTQTWKHPVAVSSFGGNFYILDGEANQIFRYAPSAQGYTLKPEPWLQPDAKVDVTNSVDMAIDGEIYVLRSDGTILKFSQGKIMDFSLSGLDSPLRGPTALYATPETHSIYVVDPGNERIVQFSKSGKFERQFRPGAGVDLANAKFGRLQDMVVDESAQHLYLVGGNQLLAATIPALSP
ncbi:MAG: hypothetical protein HY326_03280 [Chloroflexi bacterium]|nr:hypothetical protein [Chloroflexota bacterium]